MKNPAEHSRDGGEARLDGPYAVVVLGAGGHATEVCAYVLAIGRTSGGPALLGCVDDHKIPGSVDHVTVLGPLESLRTLRAAGRPLGLITATGDNALRRQFVERVGGLRLSNAQWWTLVHPAAIVGPSVALGEGTCLAPGSVVTARARLGRHCIVNVHASISHDTTLGDFVNVNPGAVVAGAVTIGDGCYIGAGATIIDHVNVGAGTMVGAGAVVIEDLPPGVTAVGVPARPIKVHAVNAWEPAPSRGAIRR